MWQNIRLGAFITGALTILAIGVFLIGREQFLFSSTYHLKSSFDNVIGLKEGAAVRVGGIHKGTVEQILLPTNPEGKVIVVLQVENSTHGVVKKDSQSSIQTEGLLGDKYVAVSFGSRDAPDVHDGDTIEGQPPMDFSALIKKADNILNTTEETVRNANQATENFRSIGEKIDRGKGTVGALINDRKMYEHASAATKHAQQGVAAFEENMEALKHNWFLRGFFKDRGYTDTKELTQHEIAALPQAPAIKDFAYKGKDIFDKENTAKIVHKGALDKAGKFLESNNFGVAVVIASTGVKGGAQENLLLSQARAMVVREYLVNNFKVDDTRLRTMGTGETARADAAPGGQVDIRVYPAGAAVPPPKSSASTGGQ
jgi:phospholipid/cholesterol/gamma-HCH transport system substrate-binding protein